MSTTRWSLMGSAVVLIAACVGGSGTALAQKPGASSPRHGSGTPFAALQQQIDSLQQQIELLTQEVATSGGESDVRIQYVFAGMYPGTSVSRAFCPAGTKVTGGGGFSVNGVGLQQSHPISDITGVNAFGTTAIGWQVAATDFSNVQAFVVCIGRSSP